MYRIVTSGNTKVVTLGKISRNLGISSEVCALSDGETYLGMVSHKTLVFFATEFADYALKNYAKRDLPEAEASIRLTRKWLEDQESVSNEELRAAYRATHDAAANTAYLANSAAVSAAVYAAAYAAYAAYTVYAAYAAGAVANAAGLDKDKDKEFIRQGEFILDFLKTGNQLFLV
jgi:hypothetical protein